MKNVYQIIDLSELYTIGIFDSLENAKTAMKEKYEKNPSKYYQISETVMNTIDLAKTYNFPENRVANGDLITDPILL